MIRSADSRLAADRANPTTKRGSTTPVAWSRSGVVAFTPLSSAIVLTWRGDRCFSELWLLPWNDDCLSALPAVRNGSDVTWTDTLRLFF